MAAVKVRFVDPRDRSTSWLTRTRTGGQVDALIPPGSLVPDDEGRRRASWTRAGWAAEADVRADEPMFAERLGVEAAIGAARHWNGQQKWVVQTTVTYVHLLLEHVAARVEQDGELTPEVSRVLADPALDLLLQLLSAASGSDELLDVLRQELQDLPMLTSDVLRLEAPDIRRACVPGAA